MKVRWHARGSRWSAALVWRANVRRDSEWRCSVDRISRHLLLRWRRSRQQVHEHLVEPLGVQIILYFDGLEFDLGFIPIAPRHRIAVAVAFVEIDIDEAPFFFC